MRGRGRGRKEELPRKDEGEPPFHLHIPVDLDKPRDFLRSVCPLLLLLLPLLYEFMAFIH